MELRQSLKDFFFIHFQHVPYDLKIFYCNYEFKTCYIFLCINPYTFFTLISFYIFLLFFIFLKKGISIFLSLLLKKYVQIALKEELQKCCLSFLFYVCFVCYLCNMILRSDDLTFTVLRWFFFFVVYISLWNSVSLTWKFDLVNIRQLLWLVEAPKYG